MWRSMRAFLVVLFFCLCVMGLHCTLDVLSIFVQILALGEALEEIYKAQTVAANNLSSATYLLNFLICLWTDMSEEESKLLEGAISPVVYNGTDQVVIGVNSNLPLKYLVLVEVLVNS